MKIMGQIKAKAESLKGQELIDYIKSQNLTESEKEAVRSHLRTIARLKNASK